MNAQQIAIGQKVGNFEIVGVKEIIHGEYFPNTNISHKISLRGNRGAKRWAYVYSDVRGIGKLENATAGFYFEGIGVIDGRA